MNFKAANALSKFNWFKRLFSACWIYSSLRKMWLQEKWLCKKHKSSILISSACDDQLWNLHFQLLLFLKVTLPQSSSVCVNQMIFDRIVLPNDIPIFLDLYYNKNYINCPIYQKHCKNGTSNILNGMGIQLQFKGITAETR